MLLTETVGNEVLWSLDSQCTAEVISAACTHLTVARSEARDTGFPGRLADTAQCPGCAAGSIEPQQHMLQILGACDGKGEAMIMYIVIN